ncbi:hypothetical protein IWX58_004931 [Rubrivivax gelatinosus]|nr:hypothetical protein [Rubrivivax gelatinosus]
MGTSIYAWDNRRGRMSATAISPPNRARRARRTSPEAKAAIRRRPTQTTDPSAAARPRQRTSPPQLKPNGSPAANATTSRTPSPPHAANHSRPYPAAYPIPPSPGHRRPHADPSNVRHGPDCTPPHRGQATQELHARRSRPLRQALQDGTPTFDGQATAGRTPPARPGPAITCPAHTSGSRANLAAGTTRRHAPFDGPATNVVSARPHRPESSPPQKRSRPRSRKNKRAQTEQGGSARSRRTLPR